MLEATGLAGDFSHALTWRRELLTISHASKQGRMDYKYIIFSSTIRVLIESSGIGVANGSIVKRQRV